ncbi:MAG: CPBP family intramembrane metalloprotease [Bacteroidales bacterium]|nr:CPBP family intramembrane metalloprotease [Bacteroidales bacterium]MBN2758205.1 CPBP family intramembrane metalloprotease [Bacteroidales bacterium]
MFLNLFGNNSNLSKLFVALFIIVISFLIIMIIGTLIAIPIFNVNFESLTNPDITDYQHINLFKFLQSIYSIGIFIVPPIILAILFSDNPKKYLYLNKLPFLLSAVSVSFIVIFSIPIINFLAELNSNMHFPESFSSIEKIMKDMENEAERITVAFLKTNGISGFIINIIVIALIPAIGEELLFRGIFQKLFTDWTKNSHSGVWIAAFLFSAMHFQFYGFLPRLLIGVFLGYTLVLSKNLWLPIIAHFVNNAFAVSSYFLSNKEIIDQSTETIGTGQNSIVILTISIILVFSLIYIFYRNEKEKSAINQI